MIYIHDNGGCSVFVGDDDELDMTNFGVSIIYPDGISTASVHTSGVCWGVVWVELGIFMFFQ